MKLCRRVGELTKWSAGDESVASLDSSTPRLVKNCVIKCCCAGVMELGSRPRVALARRLPNLDAPCWRPHVAQVKHLWSTTAPAAKHGVATLGTRGGGSRGFLSARRGVDACSR